jgi:hypothetical protein
MADNTQLNSGTGGDIIAADDIGGVKVQRIKIIHGDDGVNDGDVSRNNPLPVEEKNSLAVLEKLSADPSTATKQDAIISALVALLTEMGLKADGSETQPVSLVSVPLPTGAATQTTSAAILAKLIASPATEGKQDTIIGHVDGIETALGSILTKISSSPATETKQDTMITALAALLTELANKADVSETQPVSLASVPLPTGAATQTTSAAILAKLIASPATEGKQDTIIGHVDGIETALASILAKIIAAPATETKQDTAITALNSILASTGAVADAIVAAGAAGSISAKLRRMTQGLEDLKTAIVLGAGTNAIGKLAANAGVIIGAVELVASTSGGSTMHSTLCANSNNATNIKNSTGKIFGITVSNIGATPVYLKLYNKASAPAPATDNALIVKRIMIPGNTTGAGNNIPVPSVGLDFSTGISYAVVTGISDTNNGSVNASEVIINIDWK